MGWLARILGETPEGAESSWRSRDRYRNSQITHEGGSTSANASPYRNFLYDDAFKSQAGTSDPREPATIEKIAERTRIEARSMVTRRRSRANDRPNRAISDGKATFESLTRPHVAPLWRVALRMTGDRDEADDLTQETCLRAYRGFDRFQEGTNYRAWLFRIMTNLCMDLLRRRARSPLVATCEEGDPAPGLAPETEGPDAQLVRKRFREELVRAIQNLSPDIRLVVSLALLEGLSYQEIAEIAGCPVGTVRSRLSRGRQQLRRDLKDYMPRSAPTLRLVASATDRNGSGRGRPACGHEHRNCHDGEQ